MRRCAPSCTGSPRTARCCSSSTTCTGPTRVRSCCSSTPAAISRGRRCSILGTYRDTELTRTHPLSQALATLNREPNFSRLSIRGLDRAQVSAYIQRSAGFEPTREQLDAFMRETAGNAFFLTEIVSGMLGRGTFDDRTVKFEIPDGDREALARRVNALSEDAVDLLKLAAVIGYEFDFATLSVVSEQSADRELELVEEALRENVIAESERPGAYRFAYQPMQRLLLEELSATRRMRLHGQIGEQLEASYGNQAEQHARAPRPALHGVAHTHARASREGAALQLARRAAGRGRRGDQRGGGFL